MLGAPNSSYAWIKYFAFLISLGDHDKARALAERALATINYRCARRARERAEGERGGGGGGGRRALGKGRQAAFQSVPYPYQ